MIIEAVGNEAPVLYAAEELARYLHLAFGLNCNLAGPGDLLVGDSAELRYRPDSGAHGVAARDLPAEDPAIDEFMIDVACTRDTFTGVICGSNPRSTLIGAYQLLHVLGFCWLHPGPSGEFVPDPATTLPERVHLAERASYPHRGICIEGAVSYEHVRSVIEWLPRVGMNAYFIQFREAYTFFERWYSRHPDELSAARSGYRPAAAHLESTSADPGRADFTVDDARSIVGRVAEDIAQRGLFHHAVGHGWTCEPFGIPGIEWKEYSEPITDEVRQFFAKIDGTRGLYGVVPLNTNLCYSNPEVRSRIVSAVVDYAAGHPEVTHLHFWLADGNNNQCECADCRKLRPADFYAKMLNAVDEELSKRNIPTKIVFLIYFDLLWPPEQVELRETDRFILMFAPITRSYAAPFMTPSGDVRPGGRRSGPTPVGDEARQAGGGNSGAELPPYVRNQLEFPKSPDGNLAFLRAWRTVFDGDSFDFDYHLMWDHYLDPGYMSIARTLHADVRDLTDLGLNGLVSCQVQRAAFPTALPVYAMAATLWNRTREFSDICDEYFTTAFGRYGREIRTYLTRLSELFAPLLSGRADALTRGNAMQFEGAPALAESVVSQLRERRLDKTLTKSRRVAIDRLIAHAELTIGLSDALAKAAYSSRNAGAARWKEVAERALALEGDFHQVFDARLYTDVLGSRLFSGR